MEVTFTCFSRLNISGMLILANLSGRNLNWLQPIRVNSFAILLWISWGKGPWFCYPKVTLIGIFNIMFKSLCLHILYTYIHIFFFTSEVLPELPIDGWILHLQNRVLSAPGCRQQEWTQFLNYLNKNMGGKSQMQCNLEIKMHFRLSTESAPGGKEMVI